MFTQSNMQHPCTSVYLYRCDDSLWNSKDASLNKGLDSHRIIDLFINNDINCHIVICPNVSVEKSNIGTDAGGCSQSLCYSLFLESMSTLTLPRYLLSIHIWFADSILHIMHNNTKRVQDYLRHWLQHLSWWAGSNIAFLCVCDKFILIKCSRQNLFSL